MEICRSDISSPQKRSRSSSLLLCNTYPLNTTITYKKSMLSHILQLKFLFVQRKSRTPFYLASSLTKGTLPKEKEIPSWALTPREEYWRSIQKNIKGSCVFNTCSCVLWVRGVCHSFLHSAGVARSLGQEEKIQLCCQLWSNHGHHEKHLFKCLRAFEQKINRQIQDESVCLPFLGIFHTMFHAIWSFFGCVVFQLSGPLVSREKQF